VVAGVAAARNLLHLHQVTLSIHGGTAPLPSTGTFDWHYLQCVLKSFGTPEYKNFLNIKYFVHPFKTDSDDSGSDNEYPDNDENKLLWPTYQYDQLLMEQGKREMEREGYNAVEQWRNKVY
jgi:hypothetical protein